MASNKYSVILKKLYDINLENPVKMGLDNSHALYKLLGNPLSNTPIIHVTGTNGKGSVTLKVAECFRHHNLRTGLFISPHISSFRERIQVDTEKISEDEFMEYFIEISSLCKSNNIPATFFEIATAMGFTHFHRKACDVVALEVGLGGRLDATNVIQSTPAAKNHSLSIITSIQLDHVKILGNTIEQIAYEKAGIMKPGVKCLVGPGCPIDFLRKLAKEVGAPFYTLNDVLTPSQRLYEYNNSEYEGEDLQDIDYLNTDIALAAMTLVQEYSPKVSSSLPSSQSLFSSLFMSAKATLPSSTITADTINTNIDTTVSNTSTSTDTSTFDKITNSLRDVPWEEFQSTMVTVRPPCRFEFLNVNVHLADDEHQQQRLEQQQQNERQVVGVDVILDIAHNSDAMVALMDRMNKYFPKHPFRVVLGMSADKDVAAVVRILLTYIPSEHIYCVAANTPRALSVKELSAIIQEVSASMNIHSPPPPSSSSSVPFQSSELPTSILSSSSDLPSESQSLAQNDKYENLSGDIRAGVKAAIASAATAAARRNDDIFVSKLIQSDNSNHNNDDSNNASTLAGLNVSELIKQEELKQQQQQQQQLQNEVEAERGVVLICGTAFIMSEARAVLGIIEPRDAESLAVAISATSTSPILQQTHHAGGKDSNGNDSIVYTDAQEYFAPPPSTSSTATTSKKDAV